MKGKKKEKEKKRRLYGIKTAAVIVATVMAASGTAVPAFAANDMGSATNPSATMTTKTVKGGKTTFDKYLVMKKNANVPNATFSYKVSIPDDSDVDTLLQGVEEYKTQDTNNTYLSVRKGIYGKGENGEKVLPTVTNTVFKAGDQTYDEVQKARTNEESKSYTDKANDKVYLYDGVKYGYSKYYGDSPDVVLKKGQKYAKHTATVDLSKITFSEPGVYRYKITENSSEEKGIRVDGRRKYLDVYVESDTNGKLSIAGYVLHASQVMQPKGDSASPGSNNPDEKNTGFENEYDTGDLVLEKKVTGNQGFRDQYFKFHIDITNLDSEARLFLTDADGNKIYTSKDTVPYDYNAGTGRRDDGQKRFVAKEGTLGDKTIGKGTLLDDIDLMTPSVFTITDAGTKGKTVEETVGLPTKENVPDDAKGLAVIANENGEISFDAYLKHGETLKINGLTDQAKYQVKETSEDYTASAAKYTDYKNVHDMVTKIIPDDFLMSEVFAADRGRTEQKSITLNHDEKNHTDTTDMQTFDNLPFGAKDHQTDGNEFVIFTNNREGMLPTGFYHNNKATFNIIGIAAAGSAIAIVIRKRRKEKE